MTTIDRITDQMVQTAADAIMGEVPTGYGMTKAEAIAYSRAALSAALQEGQENPAAYPHLVGALSELLSAAEMVMEGLDARIQAADKHAVPVFYGIVDLSDAIHKASAALATTEGQP